eukprot:TRINITY_DN4880_c1_g2_i10.p1 TRINITY_DN4880_c1_g2~~TRINITY_DN4880_c1_g2_i10.p1  ORF type:complete len:517 (-),score=58.25 TRINITY_DN4880_c1_g2_i10:783-2228(-)
MSATRTGMRPRQLDFNKQLNIVRNIEDLDSPDTNNAGSNDPPTTVPVTEQQQVASGPPVQPFNIQAKDGQQGSKRKSRNIPIPKVKELPNYEREHLPLYHPPDTYVKSVLVPGEPVFVEYDIDQQDEEWLNKYNCGTFNDKLSPQMFEEVMWRLESMCAEATDKSLAACGAGYMERHTAAALSTTEHLDKEAAVQYLSETMSLRTKILQDLLKFWEGKRKKAQKPLMRKFQAATPSSDTNPFNVFRPREKIHRVQTRRRRENNEESLEKLRMIHQNLQNATKMVEMIQKREELKKELLVVELDQMMLQIKLHHSSQTQHDEIEKQALKSNDPKGCRAFVPEGDQEQENEMLARTKKQKHNDKVGRLDAVSELGAPPCEDLPTPWELSLDVEGDELPQGLRDEISNKIGTCRGLVLQFGRGGWPFIKLKDQYLQDSKPQEVQKSEAEYWLPIYGERFKRMGILIKDADIKQEQESSQIMGYG